ncbi:MAG: ATPase domain-containing protein [Candidatus Diapherotrites archaeon]
MKRVPVGIEGLDQLIQGGVPKGSSTLISGGSGTGKTIFATQFLYNGAIKFGEPGLYVTLETNLKNITWDMENFNWDIKRLQDKNLFKIYKLNLAEKDVENVEQEVMEELDIIAEYVEKMGAQRLVIDSTTSLAMWIKGAAAMRKTLFAFSDGLKKLDCTTFMTSETKADKISLSAFGVEEFVVDGVIVLFLHPPHRSIFVRKMRGTNQSMSPHPFEITDSGIIVRGKEEMPWEGIHP